VRLRLRRRRRRDSAAAPRTGLEIRLERDRFAPGETVRGSVLAGQEGSTGEVHLALSLRERSTEYECVASTVPGAPGGAIPPGGAERFAIELPEDALPSLRSMHGGLSWTVDATDGSGEGVAASKTIEVVVEEAVT